MDKRRLAAHKLRNALQTLLLLGVLAALCAYLAWLLAGALGLWVALGFAVLGFAVMPAASPRLIMSAYRAEPIHPDSAPRLYAVLGTLAGRAGLARVPTVFYLPSRVMNAFTTGGPENAAIALSDGLLRRMNLRELAGVLGHELSHIDHEDTRVMAFADLTARLTGMLSLIGQFLLVLNLPLLLFADYHIDWLPILILLAAPTLSALVQLALSRNREFEADRRAAELTGDPEGLAAALVKMEQVQGGWLERLLLPGARIPDPSLLRTHPPTRERIRRLQELRGRPVPGSIHRADAWPLRDPMQEWLCRDCARPRWHRTGSWF
jgi:heat shock protein HtpX